MEKGDKFFGCFISYPSLYFDASEELKKLSKEQGDLFRGYLWGENGICEGLKKLKNNDYGKDILIILFKFYVNPMLYELENLKEITNYRKSEKSIGISIIINNENFFNRSEEERYHFLKNSIFSKLNLLVPIIKEKKLDINLDLLKHDLKKILD